jgi:hypothetical protein
MKNNWIMNYQAWIIFKKIRKFKNFKILTKKINFSMKKIKNLKVHWILKIFKIMMITKRPNKSIKILKKKKKNIDYVNSYTLV